LPSQKHRAFVFLNRSSAPTGAPSLQQQRKLHPGPDSLVQIVHLRVTLNKQNARFAQLKQLSNLICALPEIQRRARPHLLRQVKQRLCAVIELRRQRFFFRVIQSNLAGCNRIFRRLSASPTSNRRIELFEQPLAQNLAYVIGVAARNTPLFRRSNQ